MAARRKGEIKMSIDVDANQDLALNDEDAGSVTGGKRISKGRGGYCGSRPQSRLRNRFPRSLRPFKEPATVSSRFRSWMTHPKSADFGRRALRSSAAKGLEPRICLRGGLEGSSPAMRSGVRNESRHHGFLLRHSTTACPLYSAIVSLVRSDAGAARPCCTTTSLVPPNDRAVPRCHQDSGHVARLLKPLIRTRQPVRLRS